MIHRDTSTGRVYGALPAHDDEPSISARAPGQPPNWKPKHASTPTRIYGPPPRRAFNRSSAESDTDVLHVGAPQVQKTKRKRVDEDDEWEHGRCALGDC